MAKQKKSSATRLPGGDPLLGANIRAARKRAQINQQQLGEACGVTKGLISQYEKGDTMPSVQIITKLGRFLGTGVDALLYDRIRERGKSNDGVPLSVDERTRRLPEALREFVLLSLTRAEGAQGHVPTQFLNAPNGDNWAEFAAYLEAIRVVDKLKTK